MKTFNNEMPGDMITLEMRIKEDVLHILKAMFISADDKDALEAAISAGNLVNVIEKHAHQAINEAVQEYFTYGEGGKVLRKAVADVLHEVIPKIFKKND